MKKEIVIYVGGRKLVALEGVVGDGDPRILRYAVRPRPEGFRDGLVTDLEKAASSLEGLAEVLFPSRDNSGLALTVLLGNRKLKSYSFSSSQYYSGLSRTVTAHEIRAVVSQTRSVATLPLTEFVLQALPESFVVNDQVGVRNPLGLEASRLGVDLKIFTMNFQDFKNISRAFEAAEIEVKGYLPKTLAGPEFLLSDQEKEEGALVVDMSEDATEFVAVKRGRLTGSRILELGSRWLSEQTAESWGIDLRDAERVRDQYGSLAGEGRWGEELIPLVEREGRKNHTIRREEFGEKFLVQAGGWLEKILFAAEDFVRDQNLLYPHFIFTGSGTALDGFGEFLEKKFSRSARMGLARRVEAPHELLVDPGLAPALGVFRWLAQNGREHEEMTAARGLFQKSLASARSFFTAYF